MGLTFPACHILGLTQYTAVSDWLLFLNNMHLKFIHFFSQLDSLLIFGAELLSIVWMYHRFCICSPTEGHLSCFQVLAIMSKNSINICVEVFVHI